MLYRRNPIIAVGTKAVKIFLLRFKLPKTYFQYIKTTASMAPSCIATTKVLKNSVSGMLKISPATSKCPVEETGKNSVKPSTIPKISVSKKFIFLLYYKGDL